MTDTSDPDIICLRIAACPTSPIRSGTLARGERLPSVREMARRDGVAIGEENATPLESDLPICFKVGPGSRKGMRRGGF